MYFFFSSTLFNENGKNFERFFLPSSEFYDSTTVIAHDFQFDFSFFLFLLVAENKAATEDDSKELEKKFGRKFTMREEKKNCIKWEFSSNCCLLCDMHRIFSPSSQFFSSLFCYMEIFDFTTKARTMKTEDTFMQLPSKKNCELREFLLTYASRFSFFYNFQIGKFCKKENCFASNFHINLEDVLKCFLSVEFFFWFDGI